MAFILAIFQLLWINTFLIDRGYCRIFYSFLQICCNNAYECKITLNFFKITFKA